LASSVSFQSIPILIDGHDTHGLLALLAGQLVAVLARLDGDMHDKELKGRWHLEAGFGPCAATGEVFKTQEEIAQWVEQRAEGKSYPPFGETRAGSQVGGRV
jgi:hypothetical protein